VSVADEINDEVDTGELILVVPFRQEEIYLNRVGKTGWYCQAHFPQRGKKAGPIVMKFEGYSGKLKRNHARYDGKKGTCHEELHPYGDESRVPRKKGKNRQAEYKQVFYYPSTRDPLLPIRKLKSRAVWPFLKVYGTSSPYSDCLCDS
jgi:hypothetical protein